MIEKSMMLLSAVGPCNSLQQLLPSLTTTTTATHGVQRDLCHACLSLAFLFGLTLFLLDINIAPLVNPSCAEGEKNLQDAMDDFSHALFPTP